MGNFIKPKKETLRNPSPGLPELTVNGKGVDPDNDVDEAQIWKKFKLGKEEAVVYIYKKYSPILFRFICRFVDRQTAKDIVQELFLKLIRGRKQLADVRMVRSYLYKSAYSIMKDRRNREKKVLLLFDPIHSEKRLGVHLPVEAHIIGSESYLNALEKVKRAMNELTSKQKEIIILSFYEGFTHNEIAEIINAKSAESVRKLLYRGLEKLRDTVSAK